MTLLETAQAILKETKAAEIPTTIIDNDANNSAVQVLEALTSSIISLSRSYDWQELQKEHTFNTVASTQGYNLPSDFDRFIDETFWNTSRQRPVDGPETPEQWRILTNATITGGTIGDLFRIRANQTLLFPIPTAIESFIYEYITDLIVESSIGTGQVTWLADEDVPVIDEYLLRLDATWRLLQKQKQPFGEEQLEASDALAERISRSGARKTIRYNPSPFNINKSRIGYPALIIAP